MNKSIIAQNIKRYRLLKGITQAELADILDVSTQAISKWEQDKNLPDVQLLEKICEVFDISIDELFGKQIEKEPIFLMDETVPWRDDNKLHIVIYSGRKIVHQSTYDCKIGNNQVSFSCMDSYFDISGYCNFLCDTNRQIKNKEKYEK